MMNFMQALIFLLRNFLSPAFCRPEARLQKLLHERLSRTWKTGPGPSRPASQPSDTQEFADGQSISGLHLSQGEVRANT